MIYKYKIVANEVRGTVAVITATPVRKALKFIPGQYASVGFMDGWRPSPMRCFSIVNGRDANTIRFAVRIGGPFSTALSQLQVGDTLLVRGPFGTFYTDEYDHRAVLVASGIGITPFLSMLQHPTIPTTLLYSNRSAHDIPFYDEIISRATESPNVQIGFFASEDVGASSKIIAGRISEKAIRTVTSGRHTGSTYFICGPPSFTADMQLLLRNAGVDPDRIICESFAQKAKGATDLYGGIRRATYGFSAAMLVALAMGIAVLDLSRAVPRLVSQKASALQPAAAVSAATSATPNNNNASGSSSASAGVDSNTSSTTTTQPAPAPTPAPVPQTRQQSYQPPVSSVS